MSFAVFRGDGSGPKTVQGNLPQPFLSLCFGRRPNRTGVVRQVSGVKYLTS